MSAVRHTQTPAWLHWAIRGLLGIVLLGMPRLNPSVQSYERSFTAISAAALEILFLCARLLPATTGYLEEIKKRLVLAHQRLE